MSAKQSLLWPSAATTRGYTKSVFTAHCSRVVAAPVAVVAVQISMMVVALPKVPLKNFSSPLIKNARRHYHRLNSCLSNLDE